MRARAGRRLWAKADAPHKEADDLLVVLDAGAWHLELSFASAGQECDEAAAAGGAAAGGRGGGGGGGGGARRVLPAHCSCVQIELHLAIAPLQPRPHRPTTPLQLLPCAADGADDLPRWPGLGADATGLEQPLVEAATPLLALPRRTFRAAALSDAHATYRRAPTSHRAHVLGELRFEVAARRAVLAAELGSDFASADLRLTLLQRSSGRRFGLGLGLGEG